MQLTPASSPWVQIRTASLVPSNTYSPTADFFRQETTKVYVQRNPGQKGPHPLQSIFKECGQGEFGLCLHPLTRKPKPPDARDTFNRAAMFARDLSKSGRNALLVSCALNLPGEAFLEKYGFTIYNPRLGEDQNRSETFDQMAQGLKEYLAGKRLLPSSSTRSWIFGFDFDGAVLAQRLIWRARLDTFLRKYFGKILPDDFNLEELPADGESSFEEIARYLGKQALLSWNSISPDTDLPSNWLTNFFYKKDMEELDSFLLWLAFIMEWKANDAALKEYSANLSMLALHDKPFDAFANEAFELIGNILLENLPNDAFISVPSDHPYFTWIPSRTPQNSSEAELAAQLLRFSSVPGETGFLRILRQPNAVIAASAAIATWLNGDVSRVGTH